MFVVLELEEERTGMLTAFWDRLTGRQVAARRETFLGNSYYVVTDHTDQRIHWDRIAQVAGRAAGRFVLPEGLEPPEQSGLRRYQPLEYYGRLVVCAAIQALAQLGSDGRRMTVGVIDENARCLWCCQELLPYCGVLKVYTRHPDRYEMLAGRMISELGATLLLVETPDQLSDCSFCVSPVATGVYPIRLPVLTVDRSGIQGAPTVNRFRLGLPEEVAAQIPGGVVAEEFLGAAYELGPRRIPLTFPVEECRMDGRKASMEELSVLFRLGSRPLLHG